MVIFFYSNNILTCGYKRYSKTFIDDFSRYYYVYFTNSKNELFDKFKIFNAKFEIWFEKKIKILQFDKRCEYASNEINEFLELYGIIHQVTPPYSPQSNEIAERKK
jgi:transposase InsO family protein